MRIGEIYKKKKTVISFEVFPPNEKYSLDSIYRTIDELSKLSPDFISVTYGAGGSTRGRTAKIASRIKNENGVECVAHLTCIGAERREMEEIVKELKANNIKNILALRGDQPKETDELLKGDFSYASDLIKYLKRDEYFCLGSACYPEGHRDSNDLLDLFHLKSKVDAGTDFLISQLFFDNEEFYRFKEKTKKLNIHTPISAGIIPVTDIKQIKKITSLCNCAIPRKFQQILERYADNPEALKEAGTAYALEQIVDLISSGVDGIHIYTMNKVDTTRKLMESIASIRKTF